ncbi:hypothetical protein N7507_008766, partial [Penicillium longicatenatum]
ELKSSSLDLLFTRKRKPPRIIAKSPAWLTLFAVKRATHPPVFVAQT